MKRAPSEGRALIPPKLGVAIVAGLMGWLAPTWPGWTRSLEWMGALAVVVAGLAMGLLAATAWAMYCARTTSNPLRPEAAQHLLTTGVFAISRNPMYAADVALMLAWVLWLGDFRQVWGPLLVGAWLHRVQIPAEERALARRFGPAYERYALRVCRWWGRHRSV